MKQILILIVLTCSLLAEKSITLRMENKTPREFFNHLGKITGKNVEIKGMLPGENFNYLYVNAPLENVLKDACQSSGVFWSLTDQKIVISPQRISRPGDKTYTLKITEKFIKSIRIQMDPLV